MNDMYEFGSSPQEFGYDPPEIAVASQEYTPPEAEFVEVREPGSTDQSKEFNTAAWFTDTSEKAGTSPVSKNLEQVHSRRLVTMLCGAAVAAVILMSTAYPADNVLNPPPESYEQLMDLPEMSSEEDLWTQPEEEFVSSKQTDNAAEDVPIEIPPEEPPAPVTCRTCNGAGFICPGSAENDDPEGCHGTLYVHCKACHETGKEADGRPCTWCKGTLQHLCPSWEYHYDCPDCGGSGYQQ